MQNSITWKVIHELQEKGECQELAKMSEDERAVLRLSRVHGIGPAYAKAL